MWKLAFDYDVCIFRCHVRERTVVAAVVAGSRLLLEVLGLLASVAFVAVNNIRCRLSGDWGGEGGGKSRTIDRVGFSRG